jgi:hypothetical protein
MMSYRKASAAESLDIYEATIFLDKCIRKYPYFWQIYSAEWGLKVSEIGWVVGFIIFIVFGTHDVYTWKWIIYLESVLILPCVAGFIVYRFKKELALMQVPKAVRRKLRRALATGARGASGGGSSGDLPEWTHIGEF